jgi:hypothetical protein
MLKEGTMLEGNHSTAQAMPNSLSLSGRSSLETPNAEPLRSGGYRLLGGLALVEPEHDEVSNQGGGRSSGELLEATTLMRIVRFRQNAEETG